MAKYYGYNPPFLGGHQNVMSRQAGDRLIKNDLLQLLLTARGERVMRPDWGTDVSTTLFENVDEGVEMALKDDIASAIAQHEMRIMPTNILVKSDNNLLRIRIEGVFTNEPNRSFEMEIEL